MKSMKKSMRTMRTMRKFILALTVIYSVNVLANENIDVEMTNELKDQNRVNLSLEFTVGNQIDLQELTFTVQGTN